VTEIRLEFYFAHPVERVWRAMTESRLLATWLAENNLVPRPGQQFRMRPDGLGGLDGVINADVIEVIEHRRLDMIWRADDMHLGVTWQLRAEPDGTTVEVIQTGYLGVHGNSRRDALRRSYEEAFDTRLRDVLAGLADEVERASHAKARNQRRVRRDAIPAYAADAGPVDPWAATEQLGSEPAPAIFEAHSSPLGEWQLGGPRDVGSEEREREAVGDAPADTARRSCVGVAILAVALTAFAVILTVWFGTPGSPSPTGPAGEGPLMATLPGGHVGSAPSTTPGPSGANPPGASGQPGGTPAPGASPTGGVGPDGASPATAGGQTPGSMPVTEEPGGSDPDPPAGSAILAASVTPEDGSYRVTVTNSGAAAADGWTVVLTIPGGNPTSVVGATVTRRGNLLTFSPTTATSTVPAGGWVSFEVTIAGPLLGCTLNGNACG
jgi:uncharacterized protein YndB with AHSA1/START domain